MPYNSYQSAASRYRSPQSRYIGLTFVIVFHIAVIWFLVDVLARRERELAAKDVEISKINEIKPEEKAPPPPPPKFVQPPPAYIPPPSFSVAADTPTTTAIQAVTNQQVKAAPPPPPPAEHRVTKQPSFVRKAEPEYPAISKRLGEEGVVVIKVLVGVDGRATQADVVTSSGFPRLDEAAKNFALSQAFNPGEMDGQPSAVWWTYRYRFVLEED
jgi:protein TonB